MRKGIVVGVVGLLAAAGVAVFVPIYLKRAETARYEGELAAARREGIPTSAAEFEASLPRVKPEDNAAPIYAKLADFGRMPQLDVVKSHSTLLAASNPAEVAKARKLIAARSSAIKLIEEAATYPALRVDRNWEEGFALLMPENHIVRGASRLLLLRATMAASDRPDDAIQDIKRALRLADQIRIDGTDMGSLTARSSEYQVIRSLASWAVRYPQHRQIYVRELETSIGQITPYEPKDYYRTYLFAALL